MFRRAFRNGMDGTSRNEIQKVQLPRSASRRDPKRNFIPFDDRTLPLPLSPSFQLYGRRAGRLGLYQPLGLAPASHLLRCRDVLSLFHVDKVFVRRVDGPAVSRRRFSGRRSATSSPTGNSTVRPLSAAVKPEDILTSFGDEMTRETPTDRSVARTAATSHELLHQRRDRLPHPSRHL